MAAVAKLAPEDTLPPSELIREATEVAAGHVSHGLVRTEITRAPLPDLFPSRVARSLERARRYLAPRELTQGDAALQKAAEWFLDNYYLIRRVARELTHDLPPGFVRHLPHLAHGKDKGSPRVQALARALVGRSIVAMTLTETQSFVEAYQTVSPLTIAELWAFPTMLRASLIDGLIDSLEALNVPVHGRLERVLLRRGAPSETATASAATSSLKAGLAIEKAIRALRLMSEVDWKHFFSKMSHVESILLEDPARVYATMDFETCDFYRKSVESLAWDTNRTEPEVARCAVRLAQNSSPDSRLSHVGYYLIGDGKHLLESQVKYTPRGMERIRRALRRHPTFFYLFSLAAMTSGPLVLLALYLAISGVGFGGAALSIVAALFPFSIVSVTLSQWILARLLLPQGLPKLDFSKGLPEDLRTLVVIPTLLGRSEDVESMLRQIELHYISNSDPSIQFALLTDSIDSVTRNNIEELLDATSQGIENLNARHGRDKHGPFHLLHRTPQWNASEERFMGWERKRGKLEELNRLLRGAKDTSFSLHVGNEDALRNITYVLTVDSDTQLPIGTARRLVGLLAHPLNQPVFHESTGKLVTGYSIVQPRIEISPTSERATLFARLFSGNVGFDIYTHAVSETYQDLFGAGIYVGKGIYHVDSFTRSVEGRVPENALTSHDLFEGIHGRTALATDIVLFEDYPSNYVAYAQRMHRWVRGDWQLLPWLFARVPSASGEKVTTKLTVIDRWKIFDNLRRSLASPILFVTLVLGFTVLPGGALPWTMGALGIVLLQSLPSLLSDRGRRSTHLVRGLLAVAFLAHEAVVVVDAVVRVAIRTIITRKHLLQWTSAAHTAFALRSQSPRALMWRAMRISVVVALACGGLIAWIRPASLYVALPLIALWTIAPEIARVVSLPVVSTPSPLQPSERQKLRLLARRTWHFFDVFVGPNDQWLPIDNYQEEPREQTAHRTSPTNIGMMLLSTLAAYDLGYVGPTELALRVRSAFTSIKRLEHYRGHLLNWYETKNLQPLLPRYVSTVDSGNFAGCLLALKEGCCGILDAPLCRAASWEGLADALAHLEESLDPVHDADADALRTILARMKLSVDVGRAEPHASYERFRVLCDDMFAELDAALLVMLERGTLHRDPDTLHRLRSSMDQAHHQVRQMRRELEILVPWLALSFELPVRALTLAGGVTLREIPEVARTLLTALERWEADTLDLDTEAKLSAQRLKEALERSVSHAQRLIDDLLALARDAEEEVAKMDFSLLYDSERKLFYIGYDATQDQLDGHHYDLLASEARLASYLAIVKGDVPESHWATLGRPMTYSDSGPTLLSWGGTMFEYLMPSLLMRSQEGTLLARSCELVVEAHIAHGKKTGTPWGVSESAYARLDANQTYQYQSFGVPGLGFKRGLEDDRVVAPYASLLAVSIRPRAVLENIEHFEALGMLGKYGFFEALDVDADRAPDGRSYTVVRSYMAHHQGMALVAINNLLNDQVMVRRFHADRQVEAGELLLNERAPVTSPTEWPSAELANGPPAPLHKPTGALSPPWVPEAHGRPQAFVLGNGRLSSIVTRSGGGGLRWEGLALTRYEPDIVGDVDGLWTYLRDDDSGNLWRAISEQSRTTYAAHKVEFHQRGEGLSVRLDVTIAPADDVEIRQLTLHNETDRTRRITVTSAGEPVLLPTAQAATHPAFARLFVESEFLADMDGLLFMRRPRSASDERAVLVHRLVSDGSSVTFIRYETDRGAFFGRGGTPQAPASLLARGAVPVGHIGTVLDPILSLTARVVLEPNETVTLAFITSVARTRAAALELARRYGSMHTLRWAFRDAEQESTRRLSRAKLAPEAMPAVQKLYSALLFGDRSFRAAASVIEGGHPCKRRLWGRGISGDDPIVLIHVDDPEAPLLRETIAAQRYLRSCGVRFDIVLVDPQASGYVTDGPGTLRSVLGQCQVSEWIDRHGGIFIVAADQVPQGEQVHLEASARVVLNTHDVSLDARMSMPLHGTDSRARSPQLPRLEPTRAVEALPGKVSRAPGLFDNGQGGFSRDGSEYLMTIRPGHPTPAPWSNVLSNPTFGCLVSESSLGSTWSINAGENRLTPWRNDPVFDTPSEALYLRDEETAAVWSPTPLPAGSDAETLVRHGVGYTTYTRESHGLVQELTVFVPPDATLKVIRLRLENKLTRHRRITATYYAEWVLGSLRLEQRPYIVSEFDPANACLLATCHWNLDFGNRVAFLASERDAHGFTADRAEFLGRSGDYARPEALGRWGLSSNTDAGVDPCAALQVHLELPPGERVETHFVLGQASSRDEARACVSKFRSGSAVDAAWTALGIFWDEKLGTIRVKTPEPAMDLMLNRWLLYQTLSARLFGRTGFYQSSGAFGYRDQLQDVMALLHGAPELARAQIIEAAKHQFEEGDVLHWWHPPAGRGVRTHCSDDLAWLPFVTAEYVSATGDASILEDSLPFLSGKELEVGEHDRYAEFSVSKTSGSLFEHCRRALERASTRGRHGLPLMGDGDWNDGMNAVGAEGRGESVWLGWFLCATMNRFASLCELRGETKEGGRWRDRSTTLRQSIEEHGWDGAWYLRAFHDDGSRVGSAKERECRIDSIAQSWAVLSEAFSPAPLQTAFQTTTSRARLAVHAADDNLVREAERLVLLLAPPFDRTRHDPGYIRAYPPGIRENGGQYTHAATWLGWAYAALGDGERATRLFRLLNPILRAQSSEDMQHYRVEPYVLAGDIYGASPWVGRGGWTWYTGAAAWMWRLGVEGILGLKKEAGDLRIDPCIPPTWNGFEAWIRVGSNDVHIVVENPDGVSGGIRAVTLDGTPLPSNLLRLDANLKGTREIRVRLGSPALVSRANPKAPDEERVREGGGDSA